MPILRLVAVTLLLSLPTSAAARPLVRREAGGTLGMAGAQRLAVDGPALEALRAATKTRITDFPLDAGSSVTLNLRRIHPFAPTMRIENVTEQGVEVVALPDERYFGGDVAGDPRSRVLLIAGRDSVRGFVVYQNRTYPFGQDGTGTHRSYGLHDLDATAHPGPPEFCGNDLHPDRLLGIPVPRSIDPLPLVPIHTETMLEVEVAIETDNELRNKFASVNATASYLTSLMAAANVIYERDAKAHLTFTYTRIWSTTDPWSATSTIDQLDEVQAHWLNGSNGLPNATNDLVHFVSGKPVQGGVAYLDAACNNTYHFGVSQVFGSFNVSDPDGIWDVLVFTHEVGHNLGSPHTHCYNPPVDRCYNGEEGCFSGTVVPTSSGTIMSYCHLLAGGLSNVDLLFGNTVSTQIRNTIETMSCLTVIASCGDGTVDAGEECDDGNTQNGDGCSSSCDIEGVCGDGTINQSEECDDGNTTAGDGCSDTCDLETVCGNGVKEGVEQCDDGNTSNGDGCSSKCRYESNCGDGSIDGIEQCDDGGNVAGDGCSPSCRFEVCGNRIKDVNEECDDGNAIDGDGCSSTCIDEMLCGDGTLDPIETCDDGNTSNGDGCSSSCALELCQIVLPHQKSWLPAKLVVSPGRMALRARFGIPGDGSDVESVVDDGIRLLVLGKSGTPAMDVTVPGGAAWTSTGTRLRYRDPAGTAGGVRSVSIRVKNLAVTTVDLKISSKGGPMPDVDDAPPAATVVLGDDVAASEGMCGWYDFITSNCTQRGKRLVCR